MERRLSLEQYTRLHVMQEAIRQAGAAAEASGDWAPFIRAQADVVKYALAENITTDDFVGVSGELMFVLGPVALARMPLSDLPPGSAGYEIIAAAGLGPKPLDA